MTTFWFLVVVAAAVGVALWVARRTTSGAHRAGGVQTWGDSDGDGHEGGGDGGGDGGGGAGGGGGDGGGGGN